jgi:hypothetical protein
VALHWFECIRGAVVGVMGDALEIQEKINYFRKNKKLLYFFSVYSRGRGGETLLRFKG